MGVGCCNQLVCHDSPWLAIIRHDWPTSSPVLTITIHHDLPSEISWFAMNMFMEHATMPAEWEASLSCERVFQSIHQVFNPRAAPLVHKSLIHNWWWLDLSQPGSRSPWSWPGGWSQIHPEDQPSNALNGLATRKTFAHILSARATPEQGRSNPRPIQLFSCSASRL